MDIKLENLFFKRITGNILLLVLLHVIITITLSIHPTTGSISSSTAQVNCAKANKELAFQWDLNSHSKFWETTLDVILTILVIESSHNLFKKLVEVVQMTTMKEKLPKGMWDSSSNLLRSYFFVSHCLFS